MSEELKPTTLLNSLFLCKKEIPEIPKLKTAKVRMKSGGEYSYKYADLADVQRAIKDPLFNAGLVLRHEISKTTASEVLTTILTHLLTKEEFKSAIEIKAGELQAKGADITYAKRYNIGALLDLLLDEDIDGTPKDGNQAQGKSQPPKGNQPPPQQKTKGIPKNPGDYVINVGKKFFGKKLNSIDIDELWNYANWYEKDCADKNKKLPPEFLEFKSALEMITPPDEGEDVPQFDGDEEIPF